MGMSAYGDPDRYYVAMKKLLDTNLHRGCLNWLSGVKDYYDFAASAQKIYEEEFEKLVYKTKKMLPHNKNLVIMGGCALNCVANNLALKYFDIFVDELLKSNQIVSELGSKVTNLEADLKGRLVSRNNFDIIARWEGSWIPSVENCDLDSKSFVSIGKTSSEVDEDSFWKKNTWYLSGYEESYLISGIAITKNSLEITTSSLQHYGGIVKSEKVIVLGISNSGELIHRQFGKLCNCSN
mgnify:CR=1 FL=1